MARACFVSQFRGDESPWEIPVNDCRAWAYVFRADTRNFTTILAQPQELRQYDVAIVELTPNAYSVPAFIRQHAPSIVLVGLVEGGVEALTSQAPSDQLRFLELTRQLDVLGVLVPDALPYYRLFVDETRKVQWLGVPYPKTWTDSLPKKSRDAKEPIIELGASLERGRNGLAALRLIQQLQRRHPQLRARAYGGSAADFEMLAHLDSRVEFAVKRTWPEYYVHHLDVYAVLNLDPRRSWGRLVLDCASAFIPYVGSAETHCAKRLGVLTCDPFDVETAYEHMCALLDGPDLYNRVTLEQYERLGDFDEKVSRERFWSALETAGIDKRRLS
jgi:hypothetical protein